MPCHPAQPQRFVRRTPRWFIVLLLMIIAALAVYAGYLAVDQFVWHNYNNPGLFHDDTVGK